MKPQAKENTSAIEQESFGEITGPRSVRIERILPGPIERVWAYLTESDKRAQWLAAGTMEMRVGSLLELSFNHKNLTPHNEATPEKYKDAECSCMKGEILKCEPPRRLVHSWSIEAEPSEVSYELTPVGKDVKLVLTHSKLPNRNHMLGVSSGWHTHLGVLEAKLGGRTPAPFWPSFEKNRAIYEQRFKDSGI